MIPRPRIRLPLWAALLIVVAAYLIRSIVMRRGDFSLDLPGDAIALTTLVIAGAFVAWARHRPASQDDGGPEPPEDAG